jgi:hypothetical protein
MYIKRKQDTPHTSSYIYYVHTTHTHAHTYIHTDIMRQQDIPHTSSRFLQSLCQWTQYTLYKYSYAVRGGGKRGKERERANKRERERAHRERARARRANARRGRAFIRGESKGRGRHLTHTSHTSSATVDLARCAASVSPTVIVHICWKEKKERKKYKKIDRGKGGQKC